MRDCWVARGGCAFGGCALGRGSVVLCVQGEGMFVRAETNRGFCLCFVVFCCGVVRDVMWIAEETVQSRATIFEDAKVLTPPHTTPPTTTPLNITIYCRKMRRGDAGSRSHAAPPPPPARRCARTAGAAMCHADQTATSSSWPREARRGARPCDGCHDLKSSVRQSTWDRTWLESEPTGEAF